MRTLSALSGLALVVLAAGTARAESADDERNYTWCSAHGILGMRELIDARVPTGISARGMLRFETNSTNIETGRIAHSTDVYEAEAIAGASALGLVDAGARLPLEIRLDKSDIRGVSSHTIHANGVGDLEVSGKVGFKLGPISLGPYVTMHYNSGSGNLEHTNKWVWGGAATLSLLDEKIAVYANLTSVTFNGHRRSITSLEDPSKYAFGYRVGASIVPPFNTDPILIRFFAYLDGLEYGGTAGSDVRLAQGVQVLLFKVVTVEVAAEEKLVDGDLPRHIRDVGTYGVDFAGGVAFTF